MAAKSLLSEVIRAARAFDARELWDRFENTHCIAIRSDGVEHPLVASVMGAGGEQFGLMLLRGPYAAACFAALIESEAPDDDATDAMDMLSFSMDPFEDLSDDLKRFYRRAGIHPEAIEEVPFLLSKPTNRLARNPDDDELRLLLRVLNGLVAADCQGLLEPTELDDPGGVCTLALTGEGPAPRVAVTREPLPIEPPPAPSPFIASGINLAGLPRRGQTWLVGMPPLPGGVKDDDRSMRLLLVVDEDSTMIRQARSLFADDLHGAIDAINAAFGGGTPGAVPGVPARMVFSSRRLYDAVAPALRAQGVQCEFSPSADILQEIHEDAMEFLAGQAPSAGERGEVELDADLESDADVEPSADDLEAWNGADRRLMARFQRYVFEGERAWSSRASRRFFGDDDIDYFFEEYDAQGVVKAFGDWLVLDYRPTRNSRTEAEKMLDAGLPAAEAALLRARMDSHVSLYRVVRCNKGAATVVLDDLLLGGAVTVHDRLGSESLTAGLVIPARVFRVGNYPLVDLAGPPINAPLSPEAIGFLVAEGLEFTAEGLRHDAHLFGRLWAWCDDILTARPPELKNMDGEDLLLHTATFRVDDEAAVGEALKAREDVQYVGETGEYEWLSHTGRAAEQLGGQVLLARIVVDDGRMTLTANSAGRWEDARRWVEELPGVAFLAVETHDPRPAGRGEWGGGWQDEDDDEDDDEPFEVDDQMRADLQAQFDDYYRRWLDMPLPMLGGRTPRQACRTPGGRREVAALIRTAPDPAGNTHVHVPRKALFRELGLEAEAFDVCDEEDDPFDDDLDGSAWNAPLRAAPKVGRNDPCPCGSGKKYKKCCLLKDENP
ncbi:MAG: DUF2384 domain-containing protein [Planctomycetes bacterium]|nr:DUF2384 domain-containing protein [Planctomycetota bacterium]